jgi:large exoprotein involved in heme utilization and adhesion
MNPAGIVFGPSASLNVGGSVSFTTADYLRLSDGAKFNAIPGPADASISSAPVVAFGFLGSNPGAITVQGSQLSVTPGQSISLVGGDITIENPGLIPNMEQSSLLAAPGGHINLASVASPGEILLETWGRSPNSNGQSVSALGAIHISQKSMIDASGEGGGTVVVRGGRFVIDNSHLSANSTETASGHLTDTPGRGIDIEVTQEAIIQNGALLETNVTTTAAPSVGSGGVHVKADRIEILGVPDFDTFPFTGIQSNVAGESGGGHAGDIRLEATSITLKDLATVQSLSEGAGNAGNILLRTVGNIELANSSGILSTSSSFSSPETAPSAQGNAGHIDLGSADGNLILIEGSFLTSQALNSTGNTGTISASAPNGNFVLDRSVLFTSTSESGRAGELQFTAKNMQLLNGSAITHDNFGTVKPGDLSIMIADKLTVAGDSVIATASLSQLGAPAADFHVTAKDIVVTQNSLLTSSTNNTGPGGHLNIRTDTLQVTDGGQITSGSRLAPRRGALIPVIPTGAGGDISIQALAGTTGSVLIDGANSGIFTNTQGAGMGGQLNLTAQTLTVQNGGTISASTTGPVPTATGANIAISTAKQTILNRGGTITASSTGPANAGNIAINAGAQFFSQNGSATTEANQASGGNITIQATDSIRLVNSQLSTSVQGGPNTSGGHILLDPAVVTMQNSQVRTEAVHGNGGNINIIAGTFLTDSTSLVSASSQRGISGTVNIQSPVSSLSNTLATLPQRPLQTQHLLSQTCAAQVNGQMSSLVVAGRDILPVEPGGWLMSPIAFMVDDQLTPQAHAAFESLDRWQEPSPELSDQRNSSLQRGVWNRDTGCKS